MRPHMKPELKLSSLAPWTGLVLALIWQQASYAQTLPRPEPETAWVPLVQVHVVGYQGELLEIPGRVQAAERSDVAFRVSGLLVELPVVAGQRIVSGQVLARLDPRDFENRVGLEQARLNLARADFERFAALVRSPASPVTEAEVDRKRAQYEMARLRVEQAQKNQQDTTLRAPFGGVVAARLVDNHMQIQAQQPVLLVEAADELEVVVDLPERVIATVRDAPRDRPLGEAVFAVLPERRFPVMLSEVATRADPATQTFRVTMTLDRPRDVNVLPGMTVTVYSRPEVYVKDVLRVPETAVFTSESGQPSVWVVDPASFEVEQRTVRVESDGTGMATVLEGLSPGERVVGAGVRQLRAGMKIRPYQVGMLSE
jgi:membrane fusion protein, multidrug efflux system